MAAWRDRPTAPTGTDWALVIVLAVFVLGAIMKVW